MHRQRGEETRLHDSPEVPRFPLVDPLSHRERVTHILSKQQLFLKSTPNQEPFRSPPPPPPLPTEGQQSAVRTPSCTAWLCLRSPHRFPGEQCAGSHFPQAKGLCPSLCLLRQLCGSGNLRASFQTGHLPVRTQSAVCSQRCWPQRKSRQIGRRSMSTVAKLN